MDDIVAVYGGSFNPPGKHHIHVARICSERYPLTVIRPCGRQRADKPSLGTASIQNRIDMTRIAFAGIPRVALALDDLEQDRFTPTWDLEQFYAGEGYSVVHVIGSDLIQGGSTESEILFWKNGRYVWHKLVFGVIRIEGLPFRRKDLPRFGDFIGRSHAASSSEIRRRVAQGESYDKLVTPEIKTYIEEHRLYR